MRISDWSSDVCSSDLLERHARGHRAVADHRDHAAFVAGARVGDRHAQRGGDGGRGMADAEGVVFALLALGKWGYAVLVLDGVDRVAAAGEDLVWVGLVVDVPDDARSGERGVRKEWARAGKDQGSPEE